MRHNNPMQRRNKKTATPVQESLQNTNQDKPPVSSSPATTEPKNSFWGSRVKITAGITAIGGLVLHLMGYVSHQNYLVAWGVDPGLFPQSTDAILIEGYYAFFDRTATIFSALDLHMREFIWAGIALTTYVFALSIYFRAAKLIRNKMPFNGRRIPEWLADLGKSAVLVFLVLVSIPVALLFIAMPFVIPAYLAESYGKAHAEKEQIQFMEGCNQKTGSYKCIELFKDGKSIACGFLIDSSESNIALFDVNEKQVRALSREKIELRVEKQNGLAKTGETQCSPQHLTKIKVRN